MRTTRVIPFALAGLLALGASGCAGTEFGKNDPQTAVRNFISEAVVQENGQRACDHLTTDAQAVIAKGQGPGGACRESLEKARLLEKGGHVNTIHDVNGLGYTSRTAGRRATVTVAANGRDLHFDLVKADPVTNLYLPPSPWRISQGARAVITGAP